MSAKFHYSLTRYGSCEFKVMRLSEGAAGKESGDTPEAVAAYLRARLPDSLCFKGDVENVIVVFLDCRRRIIGYEIISQGGLDTVFVHAREVFKPAIILSAAAIIIAHNHPSGDPTPSESDIKVMRDMMRAGQLLKIELLDSIILGAEAAERPKPWVSLKELGYLYH